MSWSASVLSTVSSDTEPTIVVKFLDAKYIFNVGENTNRAFLQGTQNWRKARALFLTSVGTQRASGLPGLMMSLADAGLPKLDVIGPHGLLHFMAAMRMYARRETMAVRGAEVMPSLPSSFHEGPLPIYKDENIFVYGVLIFPDNQRRTSNKGTSFITQDNHSPGSAHLSKRKRSSSPYSSQKRATPNNSPPSITEPKIAPSGAGSLLDRINHPGFHPRSLEGQDAQEWRRLIVESMFSRSRASDLSVVEKETLEIGPSAKQKNLRGVQSSPEKLASSSSVSKSSGYNQQLPFFSPCDMTARQNTSTPPTVAYVLVGSRVRGKFDVAKANALGLKPGPLRAKVAKGETVRFIADDGEGNQIEKVVRPEDCLGESEKPSVLVFLDIPTPDHIASLITMFTEHSFYSQFRSNEAKKELAYIVRDVIHLCGEGVLEDDRYKAFMSGFAADVHHFIASREHSADPVTFTSAAYNQLRLNQLDAQVFPIPRFSLHARKDFQTISSLPPKTTLISTGLQFGIRPPSEPIRDTAFLSQDLFHPAMKSSVPLPLSDLTSRRFSEAKLVIEEKVKASAPLRCSGDDVTIIALGTGSAMPSKHRNVSGTLVSIPNRGNILLDAGEGTWGQLVRRFGTDIGSPSNVWQVLRDLKCIFISHIHGDHHIGLAKLLSMRKQLDPPPAEPIYLVAGRSVLLYIHEYDEIEDLGFHDAGGGGVKFILSDAVHYKGGRFYESSWHSGEPWMDIASSHVSVQTLCHALGLKNLESVDVHHRTKCFGVVLNHTDGWSIVFSGDTMPSNSLVAAGQNATLLIHEATMADDQVEMALAKAHSTFGQAVDVGRRMNAVNILLTHFSARYPKMPPSATAPLIKSENYLGKEPALAIAFDHTSLVIGDIWKMSFYLAAIEQSFLDTAVRDEGTTL